MSRYGYCPVDRDTNDYYNRMAKLERELPICKRCDDVTAIEDEPHCAACKRVVYLKKRADDIRTDRPMDTLAKFDKLSPSMLIHFNTLMVFWLSMEQDDASKVAFANQMGEIIEAMIIE